ncbi:hypothetical protein Prudu_20S000300 [Prunus dulcis]|uniref:Integrase catalytic domain-containing protein n=1 Tax=Prunus dulcis TaxID=3755 RepID=A0A5H2Y192_PRUDU|nr:hypothetical protein Prudu_20S000300 [Prunus dulcis]
MWFHAYIVTHYQAQVQFLQSDGGGEYISHMFKDFLASKGILHQLSCPYTPQQNGLAERKNRHLIETTLALLTTAGVSFTASYNAHKLESRSHQCIFLGYSMGYKGVLCYDLRTHKVLISRHVIHNEDVFPCKTTQVSTQNQNHPHCQPHLSISTSGCYLASMPQTSPSAPVLNSSTSSTNSSSSPDLQTRHTILFKQALGHPAWKQAMTEEIQALDQQGTWTLIKKNADGTISRYKARLVAQGFSQEYGLDYEETFSPVVRHTTVRLILGLAVNFQWELRQLDVKNAFLHGELQEEVFMKQPQGFVDSQYPNHVCKLQKSLYGLKQAPSAWNAKFTGYLPTLGSDSSLVTSVIQALSEVFELKDLGKLKYFLGLEHPSKPHHQVLKDEGTPLPNPTLFRSIVGALQYLTFTRPDIAFAVNTVCQFMHSPTDVHLSLVKRIIRYLQGTLQFGVTFSPGSMVLSGYCDADWAGDPNTRRSTTGYVVFLGSNPISWSSKKQASVSRSSTEAEYRALAHCAADISWIRQVLCDLHMIVPEAPLLHSDNLSALALSANPVFHSRIKHLDVDFHFIRERVQSKDLIVQYVPTDEQVADILTKGLHSPIFIKHCSNLSLGSSPAELEGGC